MAQFFNQAEIDEFKECFNMVAKTGYIASVAELTKAMRSLGLAPTTVEMASYYKGKDISFPAFLDIMHRHKESENASADMLAGFNVLDSRRLGDIPANDLRHYLMNTGEKMTKKEVDAVFREANIAPNGIVKYADLIKLFAEPVPDY